MTYGSSARILGLQPISDRGGDLGEPARTAAQRKRARPPPPPPPSDLPTDPNYSPRGRVPLATVCTSLSSAFLLADARPSCLNASCPVTPPPIYTPPPTPIPSSSPSHFLPSILCSRAARSRSTLIPPAHPGLPAPFEACFASTFHPRHHHEVRRLLHRSPRCRPRLRPGHAPGKYPFLPTLSAAVIHSIDRPRKTSSVPCPPAPPPVEVTPRSR
ncbi:hypothetical protein BC628DRAFT_268872 [Trametes gibbosa]|nr:hypothetical protein BC628DRAFT_268872 [Trametes gibbosa]